MSMVYRVFIGRYAHLFVCTAMTINQAKYFASGISHGVYEDST